MKLLVIMISGMAVLALSDQLLKFHNVKKSFEMRWGFS